MRENEFQPEVIKELYQMFPDCFVMKNDANYRQGFPDLSAFIGPYYIFCFFFFFFLFLIFFHDFSNFYSLFVYLYA